MHRAKFFHALKTFSFMKCTINNEWNDPMEAIMIFDGADILRRMYFPPVKDGAVLVKIKIEL